MVTFVCDIYKCLNIFMASTLLVINFLFVVHNAFSEFFTTWKIKVATFVNVNSLFFFYILIYLSESFVCIYYHVYGNLRDLTKSFMNKFMKKFFALKDTMYYCVTGLLFNILIIIYSSILSGIFFNYVEYAITKKKKIFLIQDIWIFKKIKNQV